MAKKRKSASKNVNKPKLNPQKAAKLANEAIEFCKNGDYHRGIRLFKKAEERAGNNDQIFINTAIAYHAVLDYKNARKYYIKAMKAKPEHVMRILQNGINELSMSKLESAEACIGAVYELDPENITAKLATGSLMLRNGNKDDGAELLRECYRTDPKMTSAVMELVESSLLTQDDLELASSNLEKGLGERKNDKFMYLALAKAHGLNEDYAEAFELYTKSNEEFAKEAHISCAQAADDLQSHCQLVREVITADFVNSITNANQLGDNLIFIVGLPKSGLHDIALILQESSKAVIAPELNWCNQKIYQLLQANENDFAAAVRTITADTVDTLAGDYLKMITSFSATGKRVINCKAANFVNIWFIRALFPNAKIVCTQRNIDDQILEIFFNNIPGMEYLNEIASISRYCHAQMDLYEYWKELFGDQLISLDYDEFTADPQAGYKSLMTELGISEYSEIDFITVGKPSVKVNEIYHRETPLRELYHDIAGDLSVPAAGESDDFSLNFANFDTAGQGGAASEDIALNFGTDSDKKSGENSEDDGFTLKF